jgi:hypothetical protein
MAFTPEELWKASPGIRMLVYLFGGGGVAWVIYCLLFILFKR